MYYICIISTVIIIFVNIQIFKTSTSLRIIQLQEINYIRRNSIASRNAKSRKTVDDTFEENFNSSQTKDNNFWLTMSLNLKHRDWERERERRGKGIDLPKNLSRFDRSRHRRQRNSWFSVSGIQTRDYSREIWVLFIGVTNDVIPFARVFHECIFIPFMLQETHTLLLSLHACTSLANLNASLISTYRLTREATK